MQQLGHGDGRREVVPIGLFHGVRIQPHPLQRAQHDHHPDHVDDQAETHADEDGLAGGGHVVLEVARDRGDDVVEVEGGHGHRDSQGEELPACFGEPAGLEVGRAVEDQDEEARPDRDHDEHVSLAHGVRAEKDQRSGQQEIDRGDDPVADLEGDEVLDDRRHPAQVGHQYAVQQDQVAGDGQPFAQQVRFLGVERRDVEGVALLDVDLVADDEGRDHHDQPHGHDADQRGDEAAQPRLDGQGQHANPQAVAKHEEGDRDQVQLAFGFTHEPFLCPVSAACSDFRSNPRCRR